MLVFDIGDVENVAFEIVAFEIVAFEIGAFETDLEFVFISFSNEKSATDLPLDFFRGTLFLTEPIFRLRGVLSGTWGTSMANCSTVVAESQEWIKVTDPIVHAQMPPNRVKPTDTSTARTQSYSVLINTRDLNLEVLAQCKHRSECGNDESSSEQVGRRDPHVIPGKEVCECQ